MTDSIAGPLPGLEMPVLLGTHGTAQTCNTLKMSP